jgi:hypothetical protein
MAYALRTKQFASGAEPTIVNLLVPPHAEPSRHQDGERRAMARNVSVSPARSSQSVIDPAA